MNASRRKSKLLFLLALSLLLAGCSNGNKKKGCGGETCKIGKNEEISFVNRTGEAASRE